MAVPGTRSPRRSIFEKRGYPLRNSGGGRIELDHFWNFDTDYSFGLKSPKLSEATLKWQNRGDTQLH